MENEEHFTHINEEGQARMVDVSAKEQTERIAIAYGEITMAIPVAEAIKNQTIKKGEVLQVARIAGIMAAKRTFELIPLCHVITLTKCALTFTWVAGNRLAACCETKTIGATGVEMEALTGVNAALLTVYDMCKALDRSMRITNIHLLEKNGGKVALFGSIENCQLERARNRMKDSFGRTIEYLRLSVTDRCDLRCTYCMPATGTCFLKKEAVLSYEEILFLIESLAEQGIRKVKITGGEPLTRKDTEPLIQAIKAVKGIEKVTLTTNGVQLVKYALMLKKAGLDGINISIDTLDPEEFRQITRVAALPQVLSGLQAALAADLPNIKVNTVARADLSAEMIKQIAGLAQNNLIHVRFIELMPIGLGSGQQGKTQEEIMAVLTQAYGKLTPFDQALGNGPANYYSLPGFKGKIGFISALGHCFCGTCNRIRITAAGSLKTCLHMDAGCELKPALQNRNKSLLLEQIFSAIQLKPEKHHFLEKQGDRRLMSQIGG